MSDCCRFCCQISLFGQFSPKISILPNFWLHWLFEVICLLHSIGGAVNRAEKFRKKNVSLSLDFFAIPNLNCLTNNSAIFAKELDFPFSAENVTFFNSSGSPTHDRRPSKWSAACVAVLRMCCSSALLFCFVLVTYATELFSRKFGSSDFLIQKMQLWLVSMKSKLPVSLKSVERQGYLNVCDLLNIVRLSDISRRVFNKKMQEVQENHSFLNNLLSNMVGTCVGLQWFSLLVQRVAGKL